MAYNRAQAQKLCNASELELFIASLADEVTKLSAAQLRSKIARARTLRDKNADLFRRQTTTTRAATGTKRGNTGVANVRTQQKANLFGETLKRFEQRLTKVEAQSNTAVAKPAVAKKAATKAAVAKKSPTKAAVARAPAAPAAPKKSAAKRAAAKKAPTKAAPARKPAAKKINLVAAVAKAVAAKPAGKPTLPARSAKATAGTPKGKGPAVKRATEVSKTVQVLSKTVGAHARSANARGEAKRDSR